MTRPPLLEIAAYQYLFDSYYGEVWRNDSAPWNGSNPKASRALHTLEQVHTYADTVLREARDCRTCLNYSYTPNDGEHCYNDEHGRKPCVDADRYEPLPPIRLWRTEK